MHSDITMRQARTRYFEANGFGHDGGYDAAWVDFKLGPIPFPFPNTPMRRRAVRYHDLHHLITGYATDFCGELEIAAWELGAGCRDFVIPWKLNLGGLGVGVFFMPGRLWRAFVRGRRSDSLYGADIDALLALSVAEAKRAARVPDDEPRPGALDVLLFALYVLIGLPVALTSFVAGLALLPLGLAAHFARKPRTA